MSEANDISEWNFPEIKNEYHAVSVDAEVISSSGIVEDASAISATLPAVDNSHEKDLIVMKDKLTKKIEIFNTLIQKVKDPLNAIDDEIIRNMSEIINKITYKLIKTEFKKSDTLIKDIIEKIRTDMHEKKSGLTIFMSHDDYELISDNNDFEEYANVEIDDELCSGEVVIKSDYSEVTYRWSETIDELLQHQI